MRRYYITLHYMISYISVLVKGSNPCLTFERSDQRLLIVCKCKWKSNNYPTRMDGWMDGWMDDKAYFILFKNKLYFFLLGGGVSFRSSLV